MFSAALTLPIILNFNKKMPHKITDRSIISTLNKTQRDWAEDGYRFYEFIENGILQSKKINRQINRDWIFTRKVNGKTEYIRSAEEFERIIKENFGE